MPTKLIQSKYNSVTDGICRVIIFGTFFTVSTISVLLLRSFFTKSALAIQDSDTVNSLLVCSLAFAYIGVAYLLLQKHYYRTVGVLLVLFYILTAGGIVWAWGINTPIGPLIFALAIVLAAILLSARYALVAAIISGIILAGIQIGSEMHLHTPDTSWMTEGSSLGDVASYVAIFIMLALISWLYSREMQRSLRLAEIAETALLQQKALLEIQVKERTKELRQMQLEEMQHMYRFAELGKTGVTLLHDLANHVTALTIELEGVEDNERSKPLARARKIIRYLDEMVDTTRNRLGGKTKQQSFNIIRLITDTIDFIHDKAYKNNVMIDWHPDLRHLVYTGDPDGLGQILAIIISNAIDAYGPDSSSAGIRSVTVTVAQDNTNVVIRIIDRGKGITKADRDELFKPHRSTKKSGLGIGLYITKQIVELQFSGTVTIDPRTDRTEFIITLPIKDER